MSQSSSTTFFVGIGPSGSSQLTIPLSTPTTTFPSSTTTTTTSTTTTSTTSSTMSTTSHSASPTATSGGSVVSRTPNLGAIIGGTLGGIVALLWFIALMYFAHRHNCFRRPGYQRAREERAIFEKRERPSTGTSRTSGAFPDRPPGPPGPQNGIGARTYGEPPRSAFNDPPRSTYDDPPKQFGGPPPPRPISMFGEPRNDVPEPPRSNPPRNTSDPPRTTFSEPPRSNYNDPPRSAFNDQPSNYDNRPISGYGERERPRSGFGADRPRSGFGDRPRSAYGDGGGARRSVSQDRTKRGFFGQLASDGTGGEWEGAGARRVDGGYGTPEMEEKTGWLGWLARAKDNAARRKRVKAEYEEDMRQMRGRSAMGSEYRGY